MYAALVAVTIDPSVQEDAKKALAEQIVPMVKAAPGFVAGYWLEPVDGHGYSICLFDTEEHARGTAPPTGSEPMPGVSVVRAEFRQVVASA